MPPQHGKTELTSRAFPAWYLGTFPSRRVILASYESGFAATHGGRARDILEEYGHLFGVTIDKRSRAASQWTLRKITPPGQPYRGRIGGMYTAGVRAGVTGKGADLLIIDDPVKDHNEANSAAHRESVWNYYISTAKTRLSPDAAIIVIQTRWHEDDLAGRLQDPSRQHPEAPPWVVLSLPGLHKAEFGKDPLDRKPGQALCPQWYDEKWLKVQEFEQGSYWFNSLYQQRPQPEEGNIVKREYLRYYSIPEPGWIQFGDRRLEMKTMIKFGIVDLATSTRQTADYTVISSWGLFDSNLFLLGLIRKRLEGPDIVPRIQQEIAYHGLLLVGIESTGFQLSLIQEARRRGLPVRAIERKGPEKKDKVARAISSTPFMERGNLWLPMGAPFLGTYEEEMLHFPSAKHDDQVDVTSDAVSVAENPRLLGLANPKGFYPGKQKEDSNDVRDWVNYTDEDQGLGSKWPELRRRPKRW